MTIEAKHVKRKDLSNYIAANQIKRERKVSRQLLNGFTKEMLKFGSLSSQTSSSTQRNGNASGNGGVSPRNQGDQTLRKRKSDQSLESSDKKRKVQDTEQQPQQAQSTTHQVHLRIKLQQIQLAK